MNTMLAGFVTYGASESLGLPEEYGICCVIAGALLIAAAAHFIPKKPEAGRIPARTL